MRGLFVAIRERRASLSDGSPPFGDDEEEEEEQAVHEQVKLNDF
jgi:hypothetical protein